MPDAQHSEKPTPRRIERARKEGNFPSSREFISSVQFTGFVVLAVTFGNALLMRTGYVMRRLFKSAFADDLTETRLVALVWNVIAPEFTPLLLCGAGLVLLCILVQLATTRMGISLAKLVPDINRLNPGNKLTSLPARNLPLFLQALVLLPLFGIAVYYEARENLDRFLELPWMSAQAAIARVGGTIETLLWRAVTLFLAVGVVDLIWQNRRYTNQLKMTKHEVREEAKDAQSSPHIKMRIRRLQRDLARRNMMKEVATATALIVNPTHYAVAIRYSMDGAAAPKVVAKGKNYLAGRIRKKAMEHEVPIVENAPLARALYSSVDLGQEIPIHLYRAVAEILAYIYRLMNGRLPG